MFVKVNDYKEIVSLAKKSDIILKNSLNPKEIYHVYYSIRNNNKRKSLVYKPINDIFLIKECTYCDDISIDDRSFSCTIEKVVENKVIQEKIKEIPFTKATWLKFNDRSCLFCDADFECEPIESWNKYKIQLKENMEKMINEKNEVAISILKKNVEKYKNWRKNQIKVIKVPEINAGSKIVPYHLIGSPFDFALWYSGTNVSAGFSDSLSRMRDEEEKCLKESKKIIKEFNWSKDDLIKGRDNLISYFKELNNNVYYLYSDKDIETFLE